MKITTEQLGILKSCASAEEAVAKASEAGFKLSAEQAGKLLAAYEYQEIGEDGLDIVSGGCGTGGGVSSYTCYFCKETFDGNPPHVATFFGDVFAGSSDLEACESCYQANKDDDMYMW